MDFDLFRSLVENAKGKVEVFDMAILGESLLHPRIFDMIRCIKAAGMAAIMDTNGIQLKDDAVAKELRSCGLDALSIAVDGMDRETYEKVRVGGDYQSLCESLTRFLEGPRNGRPYTIVQMVHHEWNKHQAREFLRYWRKRKPDWVRIKFYESVYREADHLDPFSHEENPRPCIRPWWSLHVAWDGRIIACCDEPHPDMNLGTYAGEPLMEAWNSTQMIDFRRAHLEKDFQRHVQCDGCIPYTNPAPALLLGALPSVLTTWKIYMKIERFLILRNVNRLAQRV